MMAPEPVFTVHDTFFIKGRGLALIFFVNPDVEPPIRVQVGDEIELTTEAGVCMKTTVRGVELIHGPPDKFPLGLLVSLASEYAHILRGAKAQVVQVGEPAGGL